MADIPKVMLLMSTSMAYGRGILLGIAKYADLCGPWEFHREMLFYREHSRRKAARSRLKGWKPDGIIAYVYDQKNADELIPPELPAIVLPLKEIPAKIPTIRCSDDAIAKMAAEHLLDRGFRNFAFCGLDEMWWSRLSRESFCERIAAAGFQTHIYKQPKEAINRLWENESNYIVKWLQSLPKPIAIFGCIDDRAQDVIEACKIAGLHIPEQVAVLGADNDEFICKLSSPSLSSVALNTEKAGYEAAELLDKLMSGAKPKKQIITVRPTHVVTRQSTDTIAIDDPDVTMALRFIRQNVKQQIQVDQVANHVAVSRRTLEMRFRKILGHSVHKEIRKARAEEIAKMLVQTNLPVSKIALDLNYAGFEHISRAFKKEKGMPPIAYRKKFGPR